tara:strand:- start:917 stop:1147 length:231 start_codon:yes stop_codon:yes gene_type:complete
MNYYEENIEKYKTYYQNNKTSILERQKNYNMRYRSEIADYQHQYYIKNKYKKKHLTYISLKKEKKDILTCLHFLKK